MKKSNIISAPILVLITAISPAYAARSPTQQAALEGGTFVGITLAATAAAGPVGLLIGSISAAILAKKTKIANDRQVLLEEALIKQQGLDSIVAQQNVEFPQHDDESAENLSFQILFSTGDDTLSELDIQRVTVLASRLQRNLDLTVSVHGYTDPRGTDEYNNVLSQERARAVKNELITLGIDEGRIVCQGHGSSFSTALKGDTNAFRLDRRAEIEVISNPIKSSVATN